jgi:Carbohydrate-binding module 48 (Isoamylase N-terminal domain)
MTKASLLDLIQNENRWLEVKTPDDLQGKVMNYIDRSIYKRLFVLKLFKYASISFFSISLVLSTVLLINGLKPMQVVFIYPHSDNVENVEVVGDFNKKHDTVKMKLDEEKGIWHGEVKTHKKDVDYVINVEEKSDADSDSNDDDGCVGI